MALTKKKKGKIYEAIQCLNKKNTTSMLLFTLYKMHDVPEYASLSELSYVLDGSNLAKFLSYYQGMTIKVPTLKEFRLMMQALLLFEYVDINLGNFDEGLAVVCGEEFTEQEITQAYLKIKEVVNNYEFDR